MTELDTVCRIDDLTIDFARRKVYDGKQREIALPALSFDTLRALVEASPAVLTNDELIERAWRGSVVSDETVTQRIRLLRKALRDDRRQPRYIETIRNVGYRLIPPVSKASPLVTPTQVLEGRLRAVVVAIMILGSIVWFLQPDDVPPSIDGPKSEFGLGPVTADELSEQAKSLVRQRNPDSLRHAIDLYEQALLLEPESAEIRASLSTALSFSVAWYGDTAEVAARAERLALEAMTDGTFFAAEFALAFSLDSQGKIELAQAAYERAVALNPGHYGARASLAYLLQVRGKLVEALSHNMIAYEQAPAGTLDVQIASCLRLLGFKAIASEWLDRMDRLDPDSAHAAPMRALDLLTRNEFEQARNVIDMALARGIEQVELYEYKSVLALLDNDTSSARAIIESAPESISHRGPFSVWRNIIDAHDTDVRTGAIRLSEELLAKIAAGDTWPGTFVYIAMLEATAGRHDESIDAMLRLEAAGYRDYLWLQLLPPLQVLHDDQRFLAIVDGMRADVERQQALVLTADWLPPELRDAEYKPTTP